MGGWDSGGVSSNLFILRNCRLFCFCKTRNDTFRITKHIIFFIKSIHLQNHSTWIAPFLLRRQKTMFGSFFRVFFPANSIFRVLFWGIYSGKIREEDLEHPVEPVKKSSSIILSSEAQKTNSQSFKTDAPTSHLFAPEAQER